MAKPNYQYKKRQKELAKKEKKELKRQRKLDQNVEEAEIEQEQAGEQVEPSETA